MDKPLKRLAGATLLQALRDLQRPAHHARVKSWLRRGGPLGESDLFACDVLGYSVAELTALGKHAMTEGVVTLLNRRIGR